MTVPNDVVEPASADEPATILDATEVGDSLAMLVALRRRLAKACDDERTAPRDLAALSRRLVEVDRDIKAREAQEEAEGGPKEGGDGDEDGDEDFDPEAV
ncbi:hypothetical protein JN535_04195 [Cellulosimicrobium cellulans]|uniref:hypothetical protein n=1 Tax=Cellulosimicrobium cellulans TaxID=1710 RepID=UPI0019632577|nr:hypothetical protein [Cellulosimicrobium cellulans]MBN0039375.1 hypothetical protein [Cellulosimicrobium cellulans]